MLTVGLYEELAFRGLLYCILNGLDGSRLAVWETAIGFALMHLDNAPALPELLRDFLTGLLFVQTHRSTGSIVGVVILHAAIDSLWWVLRPDSIDSSGIAWLAPLVLLTGLIMVHARFFHSLDPDPRPRPIRF